MIFRPMGADGFEWINACNPEDYDVFASFDGRSRLSEWKPIRVRRVAADDRSEGRPSDFPWLSSNVLIMRSKAVDALDDILEANGEILPLVTDDGVDLFALNAQVVDALDEASSTLVRFESTGRIMSIERAVFVQAAIRDLDLFRVPHKASPTYVSEAFVNRVEQAGLVGLRFVEA